MASEFFAQYRDPRWQKLAAGIKERDEWRCRRCMSGETTLHVHHKHYIKGRKVWEYAPHELVTLCSHCHEVMHDVGAAQKELLARLDVGGPWALDTAIGMIAGWASAQGVDGVPAHYEEVEHRAFMLGEIVALLDVFSDRADILAFRDALVCSSPSDRLECIKAVTLYLGRCE